MTFNPTEVSAPSFEPLSR